MEDVPERLRALLRDAGTSAEAPAPGPAWEAFRAFAGERIAGLDPERDEDLLLLEITHRREAEDGAPGLQVDLERQYGGEGAMRSVLCSFVYDDDPALRGAQEWGRPGDDAGEWCARVEAVPAIGLLSRAPRLARFAASAI